MGTAKKHTSNTRKGKKQDPQIIVVTNTFIPAENNPFPEKLKLAKDILSRTKFLDS